MADQIIVRQGQDAQLPLIESLKKHFSLNKPTHDPGKVYYTIGEVARMFGVNTSLIRFWEQEFDIIQPRKNKKGNRLFTPRDVDHFHLIYHLVKERGFTLKGARDKIKNNPEEIMKDFEIVKTLDKVKAFLLGIKEALQESEKPA